jgi:hypothetical protein
MKPFDKYPGDGVYCLKKKTNTNARHGYGLELQHLTGQEICAYCEVILTNDYYHWLLLTVDHVIPTGECKRLGIPDEWAESYSNTALCCSGCNGLNNRYQIRGYDHKDKWTLDEFIKLRDKVFVERKTEILNLRLKEVEFFNSQPWKLH